MIFSIEKGIIDKKSEILTYLKNRGEESLEEICRHYSTKQYKQKSSETNRAIIETRRKLIMTIKQKSEELNWSCTEL